MNKKKDIEKGSDTEKKKTEPKEDEEEASDEEDDDELVEDDTKSTESKPDESKIESEPDISSEDEEETIEEDHHVEEIPMPSNKTDEKKEPEKTPPSKKTSESPKKTNDKDPDKTEFIDKKKSRSVSHKMPKNGDSTSDLEALRSLILAEEQEQEEMKPQKVEDNEDEEDEGYDKRIIKFKLDSGDVIEIDIDNDEYFSVLCHNCLRYTKNQTYVLAKQLATILKQHGCLCRETNRFEVMLTQLVEKSAKQWGLKLKEFDERFMKALFLKYGANRIVGVMKQKEDDDEEST